VKIPTYGGVCAETSVRLNRAMMAMAAKEDDYMAATVVVQRRLCEMI